MYSEAVMGSDILSSFELLKILVVCKYIMTTPPLLTWQPENDCLMVKIIICFCEGKLLRVKDDRMKLGLFSQVLG